MRAEHKGQHATCADQHTVLSGGTGHGTHRVQHLPASVSAVQVALMRSGKQFATGPAAVVDGTALFDEVDGLVTLQVCACACACA